MPRGGHGGFVSELAQPDHGQGCLCPTHWAEQLTEIRDLRAEVEKLRAQQANQARALTRRQVAERLGVSTGVVDRLVKAGQLHPIRLGERIWRLPESALHDFLAACPNVKDPS